MSWPPPGAAVKYVAPPSGDTTGAGDAAALAQAITLGRYLQAGTYYASSTLIIPSNAFLRGVGKGITVVKQASGSNLSAVVQSLGFGTTRAKNFDISRITIDGNNSQNGTGGTCISLDGYGFTLFEVELQSAQTDGLLTQNTQGFQSGEHWVEVQMINVHSHDHHGRPFFLNGPTDMQLVNCVGVNAGNSSTHNCHIGQGSSGIQVVNCHMWGTSDYAWYIECVGQFIDCEGEGATQGQVMVGNGLTWQGGRVFAPTAGARGFQIGDASHTNVRNWRITSQAQGFANNAVDFTHDNGYGNLNLQAVDCGTPAFTTTPAGSTSVQVFNTSASSPTTPAYATVGQTVIPNRLTILGESLFVTDLRSPAAAPTVVATNPGAGATSYIYKIVSRNAAATPGDAGPSPASIAVTNNASLDSSNFNTLSWVLDSNGTPLQVVIVSTDGGTTFQKVATLGGLATSFVDTVGTGPTYTPTTLSVSATIDGNIVVTAAGTVVLNFNGNNLPHIRLNGASGSSPSVGTSIGLGRDNASGVYLAHNGGGVYALKGATKGNVLDDGSGNAAFKGTNTSSGSTVTTPTFTSGTAAQLADLTKDAMIYLDITLAGTLTVQIGPTSGVANTLYSTVAVSTATAFPPIRLPAGWFIKITAVTATYTAVVVTC